MQHFKIGWIMLNTICLNMQNTVPSGDWTCESQHPLVAYLAEVVLEDGSLGLWQRGKILFYRRWLRDLWQRSISESHSFRHLQKCCKNLLWSGVWNRMQRFDRLLHDPLQSKLILLSFSILGAMHNTFHTKIAFMTAIQCKSFNSISWTWSCSHDAHSIITLDWKCRNAEIA